MDFLIIDIVPALNTVGIIYDYPAHKLPHSFALLKIDFVICLFFCKQTRDTYLNMQGIQSLQTIQ